MIQSQEILFSFIAATGILLIFIVFILIYASMFQKRKTQFIQEKIALRNSYDKEILQSQVEVQNHTLQYIGRELHDNIGQLLSVARINLNILEETIKDPEYEEFIKQTNLLIAQSMQDIRSLSKSLDGDFVKDFGFYESIAHELDRIKKTKKFKTELQIKGKIYNLGQEREIVLFRIVQEILNNAIKHSGAQYIVVELSYQINTFVLTIEDNGKGFDFQEVLQRSSLFESGAGLKNIKKRAELMQFSCDIVTAIGTGTKYILTTSNLKDIQ